MFKHLSEKEAQEFLSEERLGQLGCIKDGFPYVVPVNYIFHDGNLYFHSLPGEKIDALRKNPNACFQVHKSLDDYRWHSVIAFGQYEEITDSSERAWFMRRILVCFPHLTPVESLAAGEDSLVVIFRLRISRITGVAEE